MSDTVTPTPLSKDELRAKKTHTITLPSGAVVAIRIPNLAKLAAGGTLPNQLLKYALPDPVKAEDEDKVLSEEEKVQILKDMEEFQNFMVANTVVEPAVEVNEVQDLFATPDIEMVVEFGLRQRDVDIVGHQIGGLEKVESFRTFRGLPAGFEDILGS